MFERYQSNSNSTGQPPKASNGLIRQLQAFSLERATGPDLCRLPVVLWLLLAGQLLVGVYVLSVSALEAYNWSLLALLSVYIQWVMLLTLFGWCALHRLAGRWSQSLLMSASLSWVLLSVAFCNGLAQWALNGMQWQWSAGWLLRDELIAAPIAIMLQRYLYFLQCWRNEQSALQRAKFEALQARIRPHFLFNTLNTIAGLIRYAPDAAETAVEDLAVLLRESLLSSEQLLPCQQELTLCRAYLHIEKLRLANRLRVVWHLEELPEDLLLPSLTLQPLLENAVQHGIEPLPDGGLITVKAITQLDRVTVTVSNPVLVDGRQARDKRHHGIALENIAARLAAIYRNPDTGQQLAKLTFDVDDSHAVVQLSVPYRRAKSER